MNCQLWMMVVLVHLARALDEMGNPCLNRNNFCSRWAGDGWCERNPRYMLVHCKMACGVCVQPIEISTSSAETTTTTQAVSSTLVSTTAAATTAETTAAETTAGATTTDSVTSGISTTVTESTEASATTTEIAEASTSAPETTLTQAPTTSEVSATEEPATTSKLQEKPEPQPQCGAYTVEEQTDLAGKMLLEFAATSAETCCSVCDDTAGCAGFAFFDNMCYLKSSLMGSYFKAGCQARVRKVEGNCAGFDAPVDGRDLSGVLIRSMYAPNSSVCCSACRSEDRCDGFSYFQNFCYLKTNIQGTFPKAGCSVQLRPGRRLSAEGNLLI
ncbi:unnamed protein product [Symbiodinium pilosum]|uniref:ShKT domain-containing protein n=1 Tax=Symbiodinium pilosum TaxID=2952 RepID=A0A812M0B3_SYMPI|nr:unnamed protein product [Symbiodinium pilosum]